MPTYTKKDITWTNNDEKLFLDGLGTWQWSKREAVFPARKKTLLRQYIEVHKKSPHQHHQWGVNYARKLVKGLRFV